MRRTSVIIFLVSFPVSATSAQPQALDSASIAFFRWRNIGPANFGGRVADVVGIPSPSKTFYVAAAAGGIWKTTNAGTTFRPIFDNERVVSMGALAIAPSDTQQVWAGTGEQNSRNTIEPGMGLYKSVDGGAHWKLMGLEKTQHVGRIVVQPTNPNIVYVAALGAAWKSNPERGLYKTTDGGQTWKLSKFINDSTGFVDVAMDPSNPNVLYAAAYQRVRGPYFLQSGGKGSGLWKTTDGGDTWTEITGGGFPETMKGRIGLDIARSSPNIVYALVEADTLPNAKPTPGAKRQAKSGLYRSEDAGKTWAFMNDQDTRPFYYSQVRADTKDPNRVYWSSTPVLFSTDGGKTARSATGGIHVDHHAMWIDSNDPEHIIVGDDGGVSQSWDRGGNYDFLNVLPIGQWYAVSYDFAVPYNICGGAQDNGSWCGPSRRAQGGVGNNYWTNFMGADGFWTAQDPTDPHWVYGESQGGGIGKINLETGERRFLGVLFQPQRRQLEDSIVVIRGDTTQPETRDMRSRIADFRARQKVDSIAWSQRRNWETPFFLSPHNKDVFYLGSNRVLKSTGGGENLFAISPDLSKQDQKKIDVSTKTTGGITVDATGAETYATIVALAESPVKPGLLYAGTDDGNVWFTPNDGATWTQVPAKAFPGLPGNEVYVSRIEPSHFDTLTWYIAFDNHRVNDFTPYLYATKDGGKTFASIAATLPTGGADHVHVVREDPFNRDLLFAGTSVGAYVSPDRGAHWQRFMAGMPTVPVFDLKIHPRDRELIAATHGRNFFIVDISLLEQMAGKQLADVTLFEPKRTFTYTQGPVTGVSSNGEGQGVYTAPPTTPGAEVAYHFAAGAAPGGQVRITIQDASGDTISTVTGSGSAGLHRVAWNLRGTKRRANLPPLSPSEYRDSVQRVARSRVVFDSLEKAGYDSVAIRVGRQLYLGTGVAQAGAPAGLNITFGGPPAGGGMTNPLRPAEGPPMSAANNNLITINGVSVDFEKYQEVQRLIANTPVGGPIFIGAPGGRSATTSFEAATGDYLVSFTVGGKTYKQVLRVEKVNAGEVRQP